MAPLRFEYCPGAGASSALDLAPGSGLLPASGRNGSFGREGAQERWQGREGTCSPPPHPLPPLCMSISPPPAPPPAGSSFLIFCSGSSPDPAGWELLPLVLVWA